MGSVMINKKKISRYDIQGNYKKTAIVPWILIYVASTAFVYLWAVSPLFSYADLTTRINYYKIIICAVLFFVTLFFLPICVERASSYLFFLIYLISYIPTVLFACLNDMPITYIVYFTVCIVFIEVMISTPAYRIRIAVKRGKPFFGVVFLAYFVISILLVFRNGGVNLASLNIYRVSATRTNNVSGIWSYLLNWCAKSFSPMFFAYFAYKRKWKRVILVCIIQVLLYLSFGFKAFLFSLALLVMIAFILRFGTEYYKMLPCGFGIINITSYILYRFNFTRLPLFTFAYRTLFVPAQCQFQYYDFFSANDYLYFSEGIIGRLLNIPYPYRFPIGIIVNQYTYGKDFFSNGNTGMFSYGYADLGFVGMVLASLVLILVFLVIDGSTSKIPIYVVVSAMSYQMIILNDTNILISLNTGGILWSIVLLLLINSVVDGKVIIDSE